MKSWRGCRRYTAGVIALIVCGLAIVGLLWLVSRVGPSGSLKPFPIVMLKDDVDPLATSGSGSAASPGAGSVGEMSAAVRAKIGWRIEAVSADARWVALTDLARPGTTWYFDLEQERFVAKFPLASSGGWARFAHILHDRRWKPNQLLVREHSYRTPLLDRIVGRLRLRPLAASHSAREVHDMSLYRVDAMAKKARHLFSKRGKSGIVIDVGGAPVNRSLTHAAYPSAKSWKRELVIHDLRRNRRRIITAKQLTGWDGYDLLTRAWLPDDRTVLVKAKAGSLYLVPVEKKEPPYRVPIEKVLAEMLHAGQLQHHEQQMRLFHFLALADEGRSARLLVGTTPRSWSSADGYSYAVWDVDLKTGQPHRRLELGMNPLDHGILIPSPSADSVITAQRSEPDERPIHPPGEPLNVVFSTATLVLHTIGDSARTLPFRLLLQDQRLVYGALFHDPSLARFRRICFIDEASLIYTRTDYQLWRFDLRTWKSELLWRPGRKNGDEK